MTDKLIEELEEIKEGFSVEGDYDDAETIHQAIAELHQCRDKLRWVSVSEKLPSPGQQVMCLRSNGTWDRGEFACLGAEALGEWYMPEGPTPCARWSVGGDNCIVAWHQPPQQSEQEQSE